MKKNGLNSANMGVESGRPKGGMWLEWTGSPMVVEGLGDHVSGGSQVPVYHISGMWGKTKIVKIA